MESRKIQAEQDRAYEECLKADRVSPVKSHASGVRHTHLHAISRSHANTYESHALAGTRPLRLPAALPAVHIRKHGRVQRERN